MAYSNRTIGKENLIKRLIDLDKEFRLILLENDIPLDTKVEIIIAGSSSLILNSEIEVFHTMDIDTFLSANRLITEELLNKYDINTKISTYTESIPYNFEDRIIKLDLGTKNIDYYIISLEDAVICKIKASRLKDQEHLKNEYILGKIDWVLLKQCALEMELSSLNEYGYKEFAHCYNNFVKENNHEEAIIENI